jgi:cytochrome P450
MRQMQGDEHRHYRKALARAIVSDDLSSCRETLERIVTSNILEYIATVTEHGNSPAAMNATLLRISTSLLVRVMFGAEAGTALHERLVKGFGELGDRALVWDVGPRQVAAFNGLRDLLREMLAQRASGNGGDASTCLLYRLDDAQALDDTMLGNIIYMVEMGRFDMRGFYRWIAHYAGANPEILECIANEMQAAAAGRSTDNAQPTRSLAHAFVLETIRSDQIDRQMRRVLRDFTFGGWLFPKHAIVRVSLWEAHHDARQFENPMRFDPSRFGSDAPTTDRFAPFGIGQHTCPFASFCIALGRIFLGALARDFTPQLIEDGPQVIGRHHWEPPPKFSIAFVPRSVHATQTANI